MSLERVRARSTARTRVRERGRIAAPEADAGRHFRDGKGIALWPACRGRLPWCRFDVPTRPVRLRRRHRSIGARGRTGARTGERSRASNAGRAGGTSRSRPSAPTIVAAGRTSIRCSRGSSLAARACARPLASSGSTGRPSCDGRGASRRQALVAMRPRSMVSSQPPRSPWAGPQDPLSPTRMPVARAHARAPFRLALPARPRQRRVAGKRAAGGPSRPERGNRLVAPRRQRSNLTRAKRVAGEGARGGPPRRARGNRLVPPTSDGPAPTRSGEPAGSPTHDQTSC